MAASIIDGRAIAQEIHREVAQDAAQLIARETIPGLATVLVGEDPGSMTYVRAKQRACEKIGIRTFDRRFSTDIDQEVLLEHVRQCNHNPAVHGILVQMPLPPHIDAEQVIACIEPQKDIDGFHPLNLGNMMRGYQSLRPCTPQGVMEMLRRSHIETAGRHVVIVGRSLIVGRPLAVMMSQKEDFANATVTVCHRATHNMESFTRQADILIVAAGAPRSIDGSMIASGAVVIDVGVNRVPDVTASRGYRLCGDVDFATAVEVAGHISPVPGGVGPMTIAMLLSNTVQAARNNYERQHK